MREQLVEIIGERATAKLIKARPGWYFRVPSCEAQAVAGRAARDRRIRQLYGRGISYARLAKQFGLSPRQVFNICNRP